MQVRFPGGRSAEAIDRRQSTGGLSLVSLLQKQLPFQLRSMTLPPVLLVHLGCLLQSVEVAEVVVAARWGVTFCLVPAKVQMNTIVAGPAVLRPDHKRAAPLGVPTTANRNAFRHRPLAACGPLAAVVAVVVLGLHFGGPRLHYRPAFVAALHPVEASFVR